MLTNSDRAYHKALQRVIERIIKKRLKLANKNIMQFYGVSGKTDTATYTPSTVGLGRTLDLINIKSVMGSVNADRGSFSNKTYTTDKLLWTTALYMGVYLGGYTWDCVKFIQGKGYYAYLLDVNKLKRYGMLKLYASFWGDEFYELSDNEKKKLKRTFFGDNVSDKFFEDTLYSHKRGESIQIDLSNTGNIELDPKANDFVKLLSLSKDGILLKHVNEAINELAKKINNIKIHESTDVGECEETVFYVHGREIAKGGESYYLPLVLVNYGEDDEYYSYNGVYYRHVYDFSNPRESEISYVKNDDYEVTFDIDEVEKQLSKNLFVGIRKLRLDGISINDKEFELNDIIDEKELPNDSWETVKLKLKKLVDKFPRNKTYARLQDRVDNGSKLSEKKIAIILHEYREKFFTDNL